MSVWGECLYYQLVLWSDYILWELPVEAVLHLDVLSLFYNIWCNSTAVAFSILKYILQMGEDNSLTWAIHVKKIFALYDLPDPLALLSQPPWTKDSWKSHYTVKVRSYHERILRAKASTNSKMCWFNVSLLGLSGNTHPILHNLLTTRQVEQARPQVKMLCGDYLVLLIDWHRTGNQEILLVDCVPPIHNLLQRLSNTSSHNVMAQQKWGSGSYLKC